MLPYFAGKISELEEFFDWLKKVLRVHGFAFHEVDVSTISIPDLNYTIKYCKLGETAKATDDVKIVWEDWWVYKQEILKSKILGKLGLLEKVPARLCQVRKIFKPEADQFLEENHLQGATNAKSKYGLFLPERYFRVLNHTPDSKDFLIAVMTFSGRRVFKDGSLSYELLRYSVRRGFALQGGFTKAFQAFVKEKDPDSVMTYADLDWYSSGIYEKFGFKEEGSFPPIYFNVDSGGLRVKTEPQDNYDVMNRGSLRMIWEKI
jgi:hypothetical protein